MASGNFSIWLKRLGKNGNFGFFTSNSIPPPKPWYNFRFKPGDIATDYYGYSKDLSIGEIDPPGDQWQPSGDVGVIMARLLSSGNYALAFRNYDNVKWNNFDFIDITAKSKTGGTLVINNVPWDKNTTYQASGDYFKRWYDFVKANLGQWIEVGIKEGRQPDFSIKVGALSSWYEEFGYALLRYGEITPPSDNWKPSGDIAFFNSTYIVHTSGNRAELSLWGSTQDVYWLDYQSVQITVASSDAETVDMGVLPSHGLNKEVYKYVATEGSSDFARVYKIFEFFKRNNGKELRVWVNEGKVDTKDKPKPPPIKR